MQLSLFLEEGKIVFFVQLSELGRRAGGGGRGRRGAGAAAEGKRKK